MLGCLDNYHVFIVVVGDYNVRLFGEITLTLTLSWLNSCYLYVQMLVST